MCGACVELEMATAGNCNGHDENTNVFYVFSHDVYVAYSTIENHHHRSVYIYDSVGICVRANVKRIYEEAKYFNWH